MSRRRHPGSIEWHHNRLRVRLCVGGRRYRFVLTTTDERKAAEFARTKYAELARQQQRRRAGLPGPVPISVLLDQFEVEELPTKSLGCQRSYGDSLKAIRRFFVADAGDPTVEQIRAGSVEAFLTWRRSHRIATDAAGTVQVLGGAVSERTVAKDRAVLHTIFAMAERREYRDGNPVARTRVPKYDARQPVILSEAEYTQLVEQCDAPVRRFYVLVLGETGARDESEALWLRWEDVDLEGGFVRFASGRNGHRTKSGKDRWTPMTPALAAAMREHAAAHRLACNSPWVFHHDRTRRHYGAGDRIRSLRDGVMTAARRAKLPAGWHLHDLRHRRVTAWLAAGKNPVHVKEAVGHSDLRTTMGYTHLAREHLRSLVEAPPTAAPANAGSA